MIFALLIVAASPDFASGRNPLVTGADDVHASACSSCHGKAHGTWQNSRHAAAYTNAIFQQGYRLEHAVRCLNCHSPVGVANEGVNCVACHVRDGVVMTARRVKAPHATRVDTALTDGTLCATCHQFNFFDTHGDDSPFPMQDTFGEWRRSGSWARCVDCHMESGDHSATGAHDLNRLRNAIEVDARIAGKKARFTIRAHDVGHRVPTGDLFRSITLDVAEKGGEFVTIARFAREFSIVTLDDGSRQKRESHSTALTPGVPVKIEASLTGPLRWRLRYHYALERHEQLGDVDEDMLADVAEGTLSPK